MFKPDNASAVASRPATGAAGTPGWFSDGSPGDGVPATILSAEFMNIIVAEFLSVLTEAGISPDKMNDAQLLAGIGIIASRNSNLLINSAGLINQRGYASGTATVADRQYTIDRWRVVLTGESLIYSGTGAFRVLTAPTNGVEQIVESVLIHGGEYTLSWEGTAGAQINGSPITNGGQVTLPANTNAQIRFYAGTFSRPRLVSGAVAAGPMQRPHGLELMLCERYYEIGRPVGVWNFRSTTAASFVGEHRVPKRTNPTISLLGGSILQQNMTASFISGANFAISGPVLTVYSGNILGFVADITFTGGSLTGLLYAFTQTATGLWAADAEL